MKRIGSKKTRENYLDMIRIHLGNDKKEVTVFINSALFLKVLPCSFRKDNQYTISGLLDEIWNFIYQKKYKKASTLLENIHISNSSISFTKFVVSLFLEQESFLFLKDTICQKETVDYDSEYRLYLGLFSHMSGDYDVEPLLEQLEEEVELPIFSKKSFNSHYLELKKAIKEDNNKNAKKELAICLEMQPESFHLKIVEQLLTLLIKNEEQAIKQKRKQEKNLEKERCEKLISFIQEKDFISAREQIELILAYRNTEKKNNYSYHLLLEALEMVITFLNDRTFEIPEVSYTYQQENDSHYTFLEAVSVGDFRKAVEVGKKCRNKPLDSKEPKLKVGIYLSILEYLFESLDKRAKEGDSLYQVVQNNIQRGHFIHALELYQNNQIILNHYQSELLMDLFQSGIAIEKKEISFSNIYHGEDSSKEAKVEQISMEDIPLIENEYTIDDIALKEEIANDEEDSDGSTMVDTPIEEVKELPKEEIFYPVEPLIRHIEPTQEYFVYYTKCLEYGQYEEAKYWLTQYGTLLKMNQLKKRLDHYYYMTEIAYMESLEEINLFQKKEELYQFAYSAMRNYDYDKSLTYLEYYEKLDTCRNTKALILKGYVYRKMGKYTDAMKCFIQANSISPNPDAYYYLGDVYYKLHRWNDAIFCYITYNEFYPKENITVYLNLSECYRKLNNSIKSLKYLKIADELNGNQNRGLNLKNRILRAEMSQHKKEKFRLSKKEN